MTTDVMRVAIGVPGEGTEEQLMLAGQMGCSGVVASRPRLSGEYRWHYDDLVRLRERVESFGLRLEAIHLLPNEWFDPIRLGLPDRDRWLERLAAGIRDMGRAGIDTLGYNWRPNQLYRTGTRASRGGARVTTFDVELARDLPLSHGRVYTADEMWANYEHFLRAILPVAEEAGVRLGLHPDDPPGPDIGGVARIMVDFAAFRRVIELADSPNHGLVFCMGCWSEMGGNALVQEGLRYFGSRQKIFYIHFREVQGDAEHFAECFIGDGNVDLTAALRTLKEVGFTGFLIDDHAPRMAGDEGWNPRSRAYQTGYIMGLLRAVNDLT